MQPNSPAPHPAKPSITEHQRPFGDRVLHLRQIFSSPDLRSQIPWLGLSSFLSNILALALPLGILQILDRVVINQSVETLVLLVLGIVIALVLEVVLRQASGLATGWLGARFELKASVAALQHLVQVPLQLYQKEEPGTYADRILASAKVADFYSGNALLVLLDFPFSIIFLILISVIGGWLVAVPILLLIFFTILIYYSGSWMQGQIQQRDESDDRRMGFLNEVLAGIHSVKTLMLESLMLRRYERLQQSNSELTENLARGSAMANNMSILFGQLMIVGVVFVGSLIVVAGGMTPGGLAACMLLSVRALQPLRRGLAVWMRYQTFVEANDRLNAVMKLPNESDAGKPPIGPILKSLELREVSIAFNDGKPLLSNLNLIIKAGEFISIRGESGSGKTSLLTLMNGMLRPSTGRVLVDGQALESFGADSVYTEISLLPQTGTIVAGTILENLTMFDASLNADALRLAGRLGLDQSVAAMKMGYETPLGEGIDDALSAGLRQVIVIARALVRKPSVILFDEANTSMDMRADQLLRDYLTELKGQCTIILVTPRPSLISLADRSFVIRNGLLGEKLATDDGCGATAAATSLEIVERPDPVNDLGVVVARQFKQPSDLSNCLRPLLHALKWEGEARDLAEAMPHLVSILDLSNLCSIMANLGLMPKHFNGNMARLNPRLMPCIFVPRLQSAKVVLDVLPNRNLLVFDGGSCCETEIEPSSIEGEVYLFRREDLKEQNLSSHRSWIGNLVWRMRRHVALVFGLSIVGAILMLATPIFVRHVYDTVIPSGDIVMGTYMALGVLTAVGVDFLFRTLRGRIMAFIGGRADYVLGNGMFHRVINLPASASQGASVSHQVGRIRNLARLREFILGPLSLLAFDLPATVVMLVAIGLLNPYVLAVLLCSGLAFAALGFWSRKASARTASRVGHLQTLRWEFLNEALKDMRAIRMVGAARVWVTRFKEMSGKSIMANVRDQRLQARTNGISQILGSLTGLMGLATSAYLAINGQITGGTMVATMMILWRVTGPLENLFMASTSITQAKANIDQTDRLMRLKGESDTGVVQTLRKTTQGILSFSRVSFRYATDADPALLGVSFNAEPRQLIVLTGSVGSGKSSILKLIERVYLPQAGVIRLDGVDIRQLTIGDLRCKISYMPQHCELFYGSIAQNLLLVHPAATDAELKWAVDMAGLADDIAAQPEGFSSRISNSKSEQLPHGFIQRLSLARTMLKPAAIVLLDEPGAGMDQIGEEALLRCIGWLRRKATVIMVSHRPGHMKLADTVIVIRQGSIVTSGAFESIKETIFSEMLK